MSEKEFASKMSKERKRKAKPFYDADEYTAEGIASSDVQTRNSSLAHLRAARKLNRTSRSDGEAKFSKAQKGYHQTRKEMAKKRKKKKINGLGKP